MPKQLCYKQIEKEYSQRVYTHHEYPTKQPVTSVEGRHIKRSDGRLWCNIKRSDAKGEILSIKNQIQIINF